MRMMRCVLFFGWFLLCGVLANAAPPAPHHLPPQHPKPPRAEVELIRPSEGFFTQGEAAFPVEVKVQPATWKKHPRANRVVAVLFMDGQAVAHQSTKTRATTVSFTFPVDLTRHAEGAVSFQVKAWAGPSPWVFFW